MNRHRAGFTLIEMAVTIGVTAFLVTGVSAMYLELSRASERSTELTRATRGAAAVLDRVAHDLEGAFLIRKQADTDPLEHPWFFVAEARSGQAGADRVKFQSLSHRTRRQQGHVSDIATLAYVLEPDDEDGFSLLRWVETRRPQGLDRGFPRSGDPGVVVLAEQLASFALRFLNEDGEWVEEWDSSLIEESSELPVAIEIELALLPPPDTDEELAEEPRLYRRRVVLPQRPLDFETLAGLGPAGAGTGEEDEESEQEACEIMTIGECMALQDPAALEAMPQGRRRNLSNVLRNNCLVIDGSTYGIPDLSRCL